MSSTGRFDLSGKPVGGTQWRFVKGGISIVEITITLVVIGILLGGIIKGQQMIRTAAVSDLNDRIAQAEAAWFGFKDRFTAKPGDFMRAQEMISTGVVNGNGNGLVDWGRESGQVWLHLSVAGFMPGSYTGEVIDGNHQACPIDVCPDNGFGSGIGIQWGNLFSNSMQWDHEIHTGRFIPAQLLSALDKKIDDGLPLEGDVRLSKKAIGWKQNKSCLDGKFYQLDGSAKNCAATIRTL